MKVFIDSDIIVDVFSSDPRRLPFKVLSAVVMSLIERGHFTGISSPIVLSNAHYLLKKNDAVISELLEYIHAVPINHEMLEEAFASDHTDKEDAIQYLAAKKGRAKYFITRNIRHHTASVGIKVLTPADFVRLPSVRKILK